MSQCGRNSLANYTCSSKNEFMTIVAACLPSLSSKWQFDNIALTVTNLDGLRQLWRPVLLLGRDDHARRGDEQKETPTCRRRHLSDWLLYWDLHKAISHHITLYSVRRQLTDLAFVYILLRYCSVCLIQLGEGKICQNGHSTSATMVENPNLNQQTIFRELPPDPVVHLHILCL